MDLFSDAPLPASSLLRIEVPLTKDQKAFNTLIKKIEARRRYLTEWQAAELDFRQRYSRDLEPLLAQEYELQAGLAEALDRAHASMKLSKTERKKISVLIVDLTGMLLEENPDDEALKALYNKHGDADFDAELAEREALSRSLFANAFGFEPGDDVDMASPESMLQHLQQQFRADAEGVQARAAPRKKTAKQQAREAQLATQEAQMSQSIREVFRKLASALHPDREQDPAEKLRKTQLMQRANDAYQKGNLLQLLELQLELEHIDQAHLANLNSERLTHYLKILKGQLAEIEQEIFAIEQGLLFEFDLPPGRRLQPKLLNVLVEQELQHYAVNLDALRQQLGLAGELASLKAWLKAFRIENRRATAYDDDCPF